MYVQDEKKRRFSIAAIENGLRKKAEARISSPYSTKKEKEALKQVDPSVYKSVAEQLRKIAVCLRAQSKDRKRSVWAICEKSPRNLDSGKHYFSLYFISNGEAEKFWPYGLWPLFHMESQDKDRNMPKYVFSSGCIGMSRLLDATDGLFSTLKALTGMYAQVDVL